jgi:catechol 2,3-dioxygenase
MQSHTIAQLAHVELLTPTPDESVAFFKNLLGMIETHREQGSVYLRGYQDTYHHSLIVTESDQAGLGHAAYRTVCEEALDEVAGGIEATGLGRGWVDADVGHGRAYRFETPDGHIGEVLWDVERYVCTERDRSAMPNAPQKRPLQGVPVRRIDHINYMTTDVPATKRFFEQQLSFRCRERVELADGTELGAWLSVDVLPHEVAVMQDMTGTRGRLHHVAFWYGIEQHLNDIAEILRDHDITIEAGPSKHGITQSPFLYVLEPGGNRIELFGGYGYLILEPDWQTRTWTEATLPAGASMYGLELPPTYFAYGTPVVEISAEASTELLRHAPAAVPVS